MKLLRYIFNEKRFWMRSALCCALILLIAGCSDSDDPRSPVEDAPQIGGEQEGSVASPDDGIDPDNVGTPESVLPHRSFEYPFFELQDCPTDPIFNCSADLTLCQDGSSYILVTDIINEGTYIETETTIFSNWEFGDVPPEISFTVQSDGTLTDDVYGYTWEPTIDEFVDATCEP